MGTLEQLDIFCSPHRSLRDAECLPHKHMTTLRKWQVMPKRSAMTRRIGLYRQMRTICAPAHPINPVTRRATCHEISLQSVKKAAIHEHMQKTIPRFPIPNFRSRNGPEEQQSQQHSKMHINPGVHLRTAASCYFWSCSALSTGKELLMHLLAPILALDHKLGTSARQMWHPRSGTLRWLTYRADK